MDAIICCMDAYAPPIVWWSDSISEESIAMFDESMDVLASLRISQVSASPSVEKTKIRRPDWVEGEFVKGPLPLSWWAKACSLPGGKHLLGTALAIWFESG